MRGYDMSKMIKIEKTLVKDVTKEETLINKLLNETKFFDDLTEIPAENSKGFTNEQKMFLVKSRKYDSVGDDTYFLELLYKWYKVYDKLVETFEEYGFKMMNSGDIHNTENNFKEYFLQEAKKNISKYTYFAFDIKKPNGIYK